LEITVVERMIFHFDRKPSVCGIKRRSPGNGPGFEDAVQLKAKIIVEVGRGVLLNNEAEAPCSLDGFAAAGLGGFAKIPFGAVCRKLLLGHDPKPAAARHNLNE